MLVLFVELSHILHVDQVTNLIIIKHFQDLDLDNLLFTSLLCIWIRVTDTVSYRVFTGGDWNEVFYVVCFLLALLLNQLFFFLIHLHDVEQADIFSLETS